jgi:hypothetical protein
MSETKSLHAAMAAAFPNIAGALKDSNNPHFRSKYADLSSVDAAIRPALSAQDLFYYQMTHEHTGGVCVETIVGHSSGETLSFGKLFVPASKNDAQGYGSALTYCRRYGLMTAFGVCPEDDDGSAAARTSPIKPQTPELKEQLQESVRQEYEFPEGPAKNITALKSATRQLWREIAGTGDSDELDALLWVPDNTALMDQLRNLTHPEHATLWSGDGKDNPGLEGLIRNKRNEFKQNEGQ